VSLRDNPLGSIFLGLRPCRSDLNSSSLFEAHPKPSTCLTRIILAASAPMVPGFSLEAPLDSNVRKPFGNSTSLGGITVNFKTFIFK
jgi:hypothetical protein